MVFQHVEKLKRDYTDKFVTVDESRPELARFRGQTGRVKTVNMNGRALVEFDHFANIGWFDIDVDYLKVVNRPTPKQQDKAAAKPAKKPAKPVPAAGEKKLSPLEMARMQDSKAKKTDKTGDKTEKEKPAMSTADILAAARGAKTAEKPAAKKQTASEDAPGKTSKSPDEMTLAEKLAAARGNASGTAAPDTAAKGTAAKEDQKSAPAKSADQMSLAEKLAAARGESQPTTEPAGDQQSEPEASVPDAAEQAVETEPSAAAEAVDASSMSIDEILAWCRSHDAS